MTGVQTCALPIFPVMKESEYVTMKVSKTNKKSKTLVKENESKQEEQEEKKEEEKKEENKEEEKKEEPVAE